MKRPAASFFMTVIDDSMEGVGIQDGDTLMVGQQPSQGEGNHHEVAEQQGCQEAPTLHPLVDPRQGNLGSGGIEQTAKQRPEEGFQPGCHVRLAQPDGQAPQDTDQVDPGLVSFHAAAHGT
ncbi:S24 family peptidase [Halomonas nitroreducens]|uniref:S24 family peptidase n=1 Tax=Halomonas nitroreducens TaxID=447425 RepID=UPI001FE9F95C|nr:S24 family peptidase [Halomonas nitroreducens]